MSLFPDEYPPLPETPRRVRRTSCCDEWESFVTDEWDRFAHIIDGDRSIRQVPKLWPIVHRLAHGRVPFTKTKLAELSEVTEYRAQVAIDVAAQRSWIYKATNVVMGDPTVLWQGRL